MTFGFAGGERAGQLHRCRRRDRLDDVAGGLVLGDAIRRRRPGAVERDRALRADSSCAHGNDADIVIADKPADAGMQMPGGGMEDY